jgi:alkaline phosphatase D
MSPPPGARRRTFLRTVGGAAVATVATGSASAASSVPLTHGVATFEVTETDALVWARAAEEATLHVEYGPAGGGPRRLRSTPVDASSDFVGTVALDGLSADTTYEYEAWATAGEDRSEPPSDAASGSFATAPPPGADAAVEFAWTGDTFGQGVLPPYESLATIADRSPDFFFNFGDTIYADSPTPAVPTDAETLEEFRAKHREVRTLADNLRELLAGTPVYAIWDDHEVTNNFSGSVDPTLKARGKRAFREYWSPTAFDAQPDRMYRWGRHVELFVCDNRSYRDPNTKPDGPNKTMLGADQREWLKRSLAASDATFKLVGGTTPLGVPIGDPRDAWATGGAETGFEYELTDVVDHIHDREIENVVWLNTDRHYARVMEYDPFYEGEPLFHEAFVGPVGAALLHPEIDDVDPTLNPTTLYADGGFFNFGVVSVDPAGPALTLEVRDDAGDLQFSTTLEG